MRACLVCFLFLGSVTAQELVLLAPRIEAVWSSGSSLHAQAGRRIFTLRAGSDGNFVVSDDKAPSRLSPPEAGFFDVGGSEIWVGRDRVYGSAWREEAIVEPLFRHVLEGAPVRLPLIYPGLVLAPSLGAWLVQRESTSEIEKIPVSQVGSCELGWGVGDDMVVTTVIPHVLPRQRKAGLPDLIVGEQGNYTLHRSKSPPRKIRPPGFDGTEGILEFPHEIPPCVADLDHDGDEDLLLCDPSAGCAFLYCDLDAETPEVTRVIRLGGMILWAWVEDLNGDGLTDLVLLKVPPLGLGAQLAILEKEVVRAEALLYPGEAGGFPTSPTSKVELSLPIVITVQNELRSAELPALLVPLQGPAMLLGRPDEQLVWLSFEKDKEPRLLGRLPKGRAATPFSVVTPLPASVAWVWREREVDRLFSLALDR